MTLGSVIRKLSSFQVPPLRPVQGSGKERTPFLQQELPLASPERWNTNWQTDLVKKTHLPEVQSKLTGNKALSAIWSESRCVFLCVFFKKDERWLRLSAVQNGQSSDVPHSLLIIIHWYKGNTTVCSQKFLPLHKLGRLTATPGQTQCEARPGFLCLPSGLPLSWPSTTGSSQLVWLSLASFCIFFVKKWIWFHFPSLVFK